MFMHGLLVKYCTMILTVVTRGLMKNEQYETTREHVTNKEHVKKNK